MVAWGGEGYKELWGTIIIAIAIRVHYITHTGHRHVTVI